jgi:hypothetical protein
MDILYTYIYTYTHTYIHTYIHNKYINTYIPVAAFLVLTCFYHLIAFVFLNVVVVVVVIFLVVHIVDIFLFVDFFDLKCIAVVVVDIHIVVFDSRLVVLNYSNYMKRKRTDIHVFGCPGGRIYAD